MLLSSLDSISFLLLFFLLDVQKNIPGLESPSALVLSLIFTEFHAGTKLGTGIIMAKWLTKQDNVLFNKNTT